MAKRDIEPKTVWTCDRCATEIEQPRTTVMPCYWRRVTISNEHSVLVSEAHLCDDCYDAVLDALKRPT